MSWARNLKMDPLPLTIQASYYGPLNERNPVLISFQRDLKESKAHIKTFLKNPNADQRSYSRGSTKLSETWSKYKPRLPESYFEEHLLKTADFLFECKLYSLAHCQGYRLYVQQFSTLSLESIKDVDLFKQTFFPDGFETEKATLILQALLGECQCIFYLEREKGEMPDPTGIQRMLSILGFLRLLMQAILPVPVLCWILYNGSVHMYTISRFLMSVRHASEVLVYLLWACKCLEICPPLQTAQFLPTRVTLYCAVCECYYYQKAGVQAEVFARRALVKVDEMAKLEEKKGSPVSSETQQAYREAAIKLGTMIFKRAVYEHRRKPEQERKKTESISSLKLELQQAPWPRTPTEKILMKMFEGNAAQFLAVVEALHDSSTMHLHTGMPEEFAVQEVVLELISAGFSLLSGFGSQDVFDATLPPSLRAITTTSTLWEMALAGNSQISLDEAVRFVKQLLNYEQWRQFDSLSTDLLSAVNKMEGLQFRKYEEELMHLKHLSSTFFTRRN